MVAAVIRIFLNEISQIKRLSVTCSSMITVVYLRKINKNF